MERNFQKSIDRMNGVLSSAPVTFLRAEGGSILATERPDQRQEGAPFVTYESHYQIVLWNTPLVTANRGGGSEGRGCVPGEELPVPRGRLHPPPPSPPYGGGKAKEGETRRPRRQKSTGRIRRLFGRTVRVDIRRGRKALPFLRPRRGVPPACHHQQARAVGAAGDGMSGRTAGGGVSHLGRLTGPRLIGVGFVLIAYYSAYAHSRESS